ncbi:MAG TPA: 5'-nucleotidase C-terminal domain-containing protein, partial [Polyangiaceae bacterium]|nr:5'-nucleotidase C-terminal domain-containing protein [Polyangiaceae bacterium]
MKDKDGYTNYLGGVAYASTYFQKERAANPNTIILNGGDEVGASPTLSAYGTDLRDEPAIVSLNYLGVNASNIGNHSFDDGTAHFKDLMEIADFDYVGVNVEDPKNELGGHVVKPYKMLTFGDPANPIKVAVVGVSNPETEEIVIAGHMGDVKITEPVAPANAAIAQARADGAHVVLVTAHIGATGLNTDGSGAPIGPIVDFAKNINGADLVQGGHTEAEVNWKMGDVMLVQSDGQLTAYNKVLITVEDGVVTDIQGSHVQVLGKKAITLSASCKDNTAQCPTGFECVAEKLCEQVIEEPDPAVATMIEPWKTHVKELFDEKVGTVDGVWPRNGIVERSQEVPMGDIITDAILDSYAGLGIQIAFMNGGGIRDSMPSSYKPTDTSLVRVGCSTTTPCDVVLGDIYSILPFNNTVVLRDVPGSVVWDVVEFSVSTVEANHGRFLQVGGIKVTYKASAAPGARVQSILFTGDGSNK